MDSFDISHVDMHASGSRLLSEPTPDISSSSSASRTGPGGDDLSISELSLYKQPNTRSSHKRPFSLLARPPSPEESAVADEEAEEGEVGLDATLTQEELEKARRGAAKTREEKLQHDLFVLKKLNAAFDVYKDALKATQSSTDRVAARLEHTNALLDKYMRILSRSEKITKLMLDETWQGADADDEQIEREEAEELERLRREEEERQLAMQRERERLEREQREREERELREQQVREKAEAAKNAPRGSGVRGVRGTRASMRAATTARGAPRGRGVPVAASRGTPAPSGGIPAPRRGSGVPVRASTGARGIPRRS